MQVGGAHARRRLRHDARGACAVASRASCKEAPRDADVHLRLDGGGRDESDRVRATAQPCPDMSRLSPRPKPSGARPAGRGTRVPRLARPRPHRRRQGPARCGAAGAGRDRRRRSDVHARRHRQGPRPRRRPRNLLHARQGALQAAAARSRALFRAAPARRGAPVRHRQPIGPSASARWSKSPLDEIPGIGPSRKRALLHHFGTVKAIERAALEDLMKTPGVNAATARAVYDYLPRQAEGRSAPIPPVWHELRRIASACGRLTLA